MKIDEREKARALRREGLSLNQISQNLGVAKSSVSLWVRDIELTIEQKNKLAEQNPIFDRQQKGAKARSLYTLLKRTEYQKEGRKKAQENNILHAMGCMLYWGEGGKTSKSDLKISNSDCNLLKLFILFLKNCYQVKPKEISIHIHCYTNSKREIEEIQNYWLTNLGLPDSCLRKTVVNAVSKYSQKKRGNTLPYGTCHLNVHNVRIMQSIFGAIQEYGIFEESKWLNYGAIL